MQVHNNNLCETSTFVRNPHRTQLLNVPLVLVRTAHRHERYSREWRDRGMHWGMQKNAVASVCHHQRRDAWISAKALGKVCEGLKVIKASDVSLTTPLSLSILCANWTLGKRSFPGLMVAVAELYRGERFQSCDDEQGVNTRTLSTQIVFSDN